MKYYRQRLNSELKGYYDTIEHSILLHEELVGDIEADIDSISLVIRCILRDNPSVFWFDRFNMDGNGNLHVHYSIEKNKADYMLSEINHKIHAFVTNWISLSDTQKVKNVYKWLVCNVLYDLQAPHNQDICGAILEGKAVCTGLSKSMMYILSLLDVDSYCVWGNLKGYESKHCWNKVKIEDSFYNSDVSLGKNEFAYLFADKNIVIHQDDNHITNCLLVKDDTLTLTHDFEKLSDTLSEKDFWSLGKQIHIGNDCNIYQSNYSVNYVIKRYKCKSNDSTILEKAWTEINILSALIGEEGCLQMIDYNIKNEKGVVDIRIMLENLATLRSLFDNVGFNRREILKIGVDICATLIALDKKGIFQRDVHTNNIFVRNGRYVLGDFGESRFVKEGEMLQGRYGALWFMAPEIFNNQQYTSKCDLYSLGIVLYFLFNGGLPPFMEKYSDGCANNPELNPILIRRMKGEIILPPKYAAEKEWAIIKYMLYNYNESESLSNSLLMLNSLLSLEDYPLQIIDNNVVPIHNVSCFSTEFGNNNFAKTDFLFNTCGNSVEQDCCICSKVEMTGAYSITDSDMEEVAPSISENESMMNENQVCSGKDNLMMSESDSFCENQSNFDDLRNIDDFATTAIPLHCEPNADEKLEEPSQIRSVKPIEEGCEHIDRNVKTGGILKKMMTFFANHNADKTKSSVYAPAEVKPNSNMLIQVYLYRDKYYNTVSLKAKMIDKDAVQRDFVDLEIPIAKGDSVRFVLEMDDVVISQKSKLLIWNGEYCHVDFKVKVPSDISVDRLIGTIYIIKGEIPIGEMYFVTDVVNIVKNQQNADFKIYQYRRIFVSYSHKDADRVQYIAEAYRAIKENIDYFYDRHILKIGDDYPKVISKYIETSDLFILCWSKNAAVSDWVLQEKTYALKVASRVPSRLKIYPLSIQPLAELPDDMKEKYNFGELK